MDLVRPLAAARTDALRPSRSLIALALGELLRIGKQILVEPNTPVELRPPVPECPMRGMPPDHLQVEPAKPAVVHKAALLRRQGARLIHFHQILGEHDTALELFPSRVFASRKVDRPATSPKCRPSLLALRKDRGCTRQDSRHRFRRERADERKHARRARMESQSMPIGFWIDKEFFVL